MRIIKSIVTFGKYDKLQTEARRFYALQGEFNSMQENFLLLNQKRFQALKFLKTERSEVAKNLFFAKTLISKIKTIGKSNSLVIKSDIISPIDISNTEFSIGDISVDFQGRLDDVSEVFVASLSDSLDRIGKKESYTKRDLQAEFAIVAVGAVFRGIGNLISLNGEVNQKRQQITDALSDMQYALSVMTTQAPQIYSESKRIIEIARTLNQHNKAFSGKYESIQKEINKKSRTSIFIDEILNRKIIPDENMQSDLHVLIQFSSEYNKFNDNANL